MAITLYNDKVARRRVPILLSVCCVFLIGLPLWWKATEVYRADLPADAIRAWAASKAVLRYPVDVYIEFPPSAGQSLEDNGQVVTALNEALAHARSNVEPAESSDAVGASLPVRFDVHARLLNPEAKPPAGAPVVRIRYDPDLIDRPWVHIRADQRLDLVVARPPAAATPSVIGPLTEVITRLYRAQERFANDRTSNGERPHPAARRAVRHTRDYQLTFSLFYEEASAAARTPDWDIEAALATHVRPFLRHVAPLFNFTLDSQVQAFSSLPIQPARDPRGTDSDTSARHTLRAGDLPHFINAQDWNLESTETTRPLLNFILYVPAPSRTPLEIVTADGHPLPSNAFLLPRWGGVCIWNRPPTGPPTISDTATITTASALDVAALHQPFVTFVTQLRNLLGVPDWSREVIQPLGQVFEVAVESRLAGSSLTTWEFQLLVAKRSTENVAEAATTLQSLLNLVDSIPNMVVLDRIESKVTRALDHLRRFEEELDGRRYVTAYAHAAEALSQAESAFFDPTMLALLYFPDNHKFGVYMPLFVPAFLPVLMAILKEVKRRRNLRAAAKTKAE
ncbi:GPI transamidase component [Tieghemiomyces parasiticus]|uniref:GPI transamidase component n=1 Tax=Tieghemiomyces parasiticus TaxID=78921 RepID=A0A9W8DTT5_9FUNG|nr:GPI transamidase component [Tieghemiomyces parasiticus]